MVGKVLVVLGYIWLGAVVVLVLGGSVSYILFAEDKRSATLDVWNQFSPFNLGYYLVVILMLAPGLGMVMLGKRLP